jgi:glutamyl-tRNA synthetase
MSLGRFAPSPTSQLHLGNLRTGLLAWLFARSSGRGFLLRIEDLDQQRVAAATGVAQAQLNELHAIGIDWDSEPVRQSERAELYREAVAKLPTYECFCTRREIAEASQAPHGGYRPYPGTCAHLSKAERDRLRLTRPPAIRVRAEGARFTIHDRHAGDVTGMVDDFVLVRNDGNPAYNLAVVVDDGEQQIDQVVRGSDLLESAPRQAWLATKLGYPVPEYAHVGLALNHDGKRLAKRDGSVTLEALAERGVTAREVFGMICESAGLPAAEDAEDLLNIVRNDPALLDNQKIWAPWTPNLVG